MDKIYRLFLFAENSLHLTEYIFPHRKYKKNVIECIVLILCETTCIFEINGNSSSSGGQQRKAFSPKVITDNERKYL